MPAQDVQVLDFYDLLLVQGDLESATIVLLQGRSACIRYARRASEEALRLCGTSQKGVLEI